jgi:hypothetical protein
MTLTRREFIQGLGVAVASLVLARCTAPPSQDDSPRGRLREAWMQFGWLAEQSTGAEWERGQEALQDLAAQHRAALDELVAGGELSPAAAEELQAAYIAATYHVFRSHAPITCYEPMIVDFAPESSDQLTMQAHLLAQVADQDDLDPSTVSLAQDAIERDIAFLSLTSAERQTLYDPLLQGASQGEPVPPFDQVELEITPEAAEAARYLVELLLDG